MSPIPIVLTSGRTLLVEPLPGFTVGDLKVTLVAFLGVEVWNVHLLYLGFMPSMNTVIEDLMYQGRMSWLLTISGTRPILIRSNHDGMSQHIVYLIDKLTTTAEVLGWLRDDWFGDDARSLVLRGSVGTWEVLPDSANLMQYSPEPFAMFFAGFSC